VKLWLVFIIALLSSCAAHEPEYLVGRWSFDANRTLAELKSRENAPPKIISCYEKQVCGYYTEIEYTPTTWQNVFIKGNIEPTKPVRYVAKENNKNEIVVSTKELDKDIEYTVVKLSPNNMYIEVGSKDFRWKEYFKRKN
jgi:hypothetical protein